MATRDKFVHIKDLHNNTATIGIADIDDIESLEKRMNTAESDIDNNEAAIQDLETKHDKEVTEIKELISDTKSELQDNIDELEEKHNSDIKDVNQTIDELETKHDLDVSDLKEDISDINDTITSGSVNSADKLTTARTIQTNLSSTTAASFDGTADITPGITGTLAIAHGGTGLTVSPSMLTNLATTSAANILTASPRPGVTGILPIANGGTGNSSGNVTGNASSATKLETAHTINGTSFDGTADIVTDYWGDTVNFKITDYVAEHDGEEVEVNGSENVTIALPSTINVKNMRVEGGDLTVTDGTFTASSASISHADVSSSDITVTDGSIDMSSTGITIADSSIDLTNTTVTGLTGDISGNADTATALETARTIQTNLASTSAASFDGTADITPGVTGTLPITNGGTGLTVSPSMLTNLASTSAANVLTASPRPGVTGVLPIANGGTGASTASAALTNLGLDSLSSQYVLVSGSRGSLKGYETVATSSSSSLSITSTSSDTTVWTTSGSRTLRFTSAGSSYCGVKVIACSSSGSTTLTVSGATWANNSGAPDWGSSGNLLVLVAHFIAGKVILNVFHNSEA